MRSRRKDWRTRRCSRMPLSWAKKPVHDPHGYVSEIRRMSDVGKGAMTYGWARGVAPGRAETGSPFFIARSVNGKFIQRIGT
jgi:hypothetical protein